MPRKSVFENMGTGFSSLEILQGPAESPEDQLKPEIVRIARGSQWGGRLKFWLFYSCRLIFFQLRLTKKLKINFFSFKKLNIN